MQKLYSGGLAEIVHQPSPFTFSRLSRWFTGAESVGRALQLLGLPYRPLGLPLLEKHSGHIFVNLDAEEATVFSDTIFRYGSIPSPHSQPSLRIALKQLLSPKALRNTLSLLKTQSLWLAFPNKTITLAQQLVTDIPLISESPPTEDWLDRTIRTEVLPRVLALGYLCEPFQRLSLSYAASEFMQAELTKKDWLFRSIADQSLVKQQIISFDDYIEQYGLRADQDYELTDPRWYEVPDRIRERIERTSIRTAKKIAKKALSDKELNQVTTMVTLLVLRSEARRKALPFIAALRKCLGSPHYTPPPLRPTAPKQPSLHTGKGVPVSKGVGSGRALHVTSPDSSIPHGTIGIFPNASPTFGVQFTQCNGLIFLHGGQTSHGAIVAREFGIPAIIDSNATAIPDHSSLEIQGDTGKWSII